MCTPEEEADKPRLAFKRYQLLAFAKKKKTKKKKVAAT
jgi:hypothetical protein